MAIKVCNECGSRSYLDECPECLQAGRGSVRDFHYAFEDDEAALPAPPSPGGSVGGVDSESSNDEDAAAEAYDAEHPDEGGHTGPGEDLARHSRNRLSSIARERGLDPTGTKEELLARLLADGHG